MPDERYGKCDVCRYCTHDNEDWACIVRNMVTKPKNSCNRYRPGSCSNCSFCEVTSKKCFCTKDQRVVEDFEVCTSYDPCGRDALR